MRLDRFLTLYAYRPVSRLFLRSCDLTIPILMYHSIAEDVDDTVLPYYRTVTRPQTFAAHMAVLHDKRFEVLTLSEAIHLFQRMSAQAPLEPIVAPNPLKPSPPPHLSRRPVVITFDDGFRDFYTTAFPILERFNFRATVFLTSGCINKHFKTGRECLRTQEIQEVANRGIEFGSHTASHPQLRELSRASIVDELAVSKQTIEDIIGSEVRLFSYPYRFPEEDTEFTRTLGSLLREQGYFGGVTTVIGLSRSSDNPLFRRRLPVNNLDDTRFLRAKLDGAYDWLHLGQLAYKRLQRAFGN
jgi:peptidoglycan/xylan/chitin deacetylase (PgdA/CDA1 family)